MSPAAFPSSAQFDGLDYEVKYVLPGHRAALVADWLGRLCRPDPRYPEGIVASIYYDTTELHLLYEKLNSDYLKTKIRVRWYEHPGRLEPRGSGFAEAKFRIGSRRRKVRAPTSAAASWLARQRLTASELVAIPGLLSGQGVRLERPLIPLVVVRYHRLRFVEPLSGARIALDTSIVASAAHPRLRSRNVGRLLSVAVLEIKGGSAIVPPAVRPATALGVRRESFSKYEACATGREVVT